MDGFAAVDFGFALKVLQRVDPFEGEPPRWVRAVSYRYRFATRAEKKADGAVWVRTDRRVVLGPFGLR